MTWTKLFSCIYHLLILSSSIVSGSVRHVDSCGNVSYEEPAILGRNVTFTFTPSLYIENATLSWQRSKNPNPWSTLKTTDKFIQFEENRTFYLVVTGTVHMTTGPSDAVVYRIQYLNESVNCTMEASKLELKDISQMNCGYVFLKTKKIEQGKKVEIEYYPAQDSNDMERTWVRSYNNQTVTLNISEGVYVENAMTNNKHVLTIFSFNSEKDGNYAVRCTTSLISDGVKVILPVAPDSLTLEGLKDIDNCTSCLAGSDGEKFKVFCQINGGTEPTSVSMLIGNDSLRNVQRFEDSRYVVFFHLLNTDHGKLMRCLVKNEALTSPISATAPLYVIKQPSFQRMVMPDILKEGDLVDITCKFSTGRPAPTVSFKYENVELSPVQQVNTLNTTDHFYSSVLSLTTFNRSWNGQNISCCGYSEWYWNETRCFSSQRVEYRFPPSSLGLELRKGNQVGEINAVCTVYDSNPICKVKWRAPAGSIHSKRSFQNVSKPCGAWDAVFMVTVRKTVNNDRENITCKPDCSDFNVTKEESIFLPYAPVLELNTSGAVLEITRGSRKYVSCTATSNPSSNISWIEDATGDKGEKNLKYCEPDKVCVITIQGHTISQRNFSCYAENLVGNGTKTLTVYITASPNEEELDSADKFGFLIWILLGAAVAVVAVVAVVVFLMWKRQATLKDKSYNSHEEAIRLNEGAEELPQGIMHDVQGATAQPDAVYSKINKGTDDDTVYSVINISGKPESARDTSQANKNSEGGQLLYVDLAFDSSGFHPLQEVVVKRRESAVEYVGIDFSKTAEVETSQNESNEMENIYVNQKENVNLVC